MSSIQPKRPGSSNPDGGGLPQDVPGPTLWTKMTYSFWSLNRGGVVNVPLVASRYSQSDRANAIGFWSGADHDARAQAPTDVPPEPPPKVCANVGGRMNLPPAVLVRSRTSTYACDPPGTGP